jgi:hypothetical protein
MFFSVIVRPRLTERDSIPSSDSSNLECYNSGCGPCHENLGVVMRLIRLCVAFSAFAVLGLVFLPALSPDVATAAPTDSTGPSATPCTPSISSIGPFQATASQSVEIQGSCFGTGATLNDSRNFYLQILDRSGSHAWSACYRVKRPSVSCTVSSWTNDEITFDGFDASYGSGHNKLKAGDQLVVAVWNPQTLVGPATSGASVVGPPQRTPLCVPEITSVGTFQPGPTQDVDIEGSCLGTHAPYSESTKLDLYIQDSSSSPVAWSACNSGAVHDIVSCTVSSWTNNEIVLTSFTGYGGSFVFQPGDQIIVAVWNHPTGVGPGTALSTVAPGCASVNGGSTSGPGTPALRHSC